MIKGIERFRILNFIGWRCFHSFRISPFFFSDVGVWDLRISLPVKSLVDDGTRASFIIITHTAFRLGAGGGI
jgi:hypothetical protein